MTSLSADNTILGLISIQNGYGYELIETFRNPAELGDVWKMSTSQIYAVLKRLERQNLIEGRVIESDSAPSRTEYHLTANGQAQFETWLHEPNPSAVVRHIRVDFLSRLYLARQLNISTDQIVQRQRMACERQLEKLRLESEQKSVGISYLAQELMITQLEAVLRWIERCELIPEDIEA